MSLADLVIGANYNDLSGGSADLDYARDGGSKTGTLNGSAVIASGGQFGAALDCLSGGTDSVEYAGANLVDAVVQTGCTSFWFKPDYSGSPAVNQNLVVFNETGGFNNLFACVHVSAGTLIFSIADSVGTIVSTTGAAWSPTAGVWYHIECNFRMTAPGAQRLFVDGVQLGTTQTDTATRSGTADLLSCFLADPPSVSDGSVDELLIYDAVQHTSGFTPPLFEVDLTFPLTNPSFEIADNFTGNFPDDWTIGGTAASWDWALFAFLETLEGFEHSWNGNEGRLATFGVGDTVDAQFDVSLETVEDFEEEWNSNEDRVTAFIPANLIDADFDSGTPETVEDFEEEWDSNEDRIVSFVPATHLTDADFDAGTPEDVEDFEEEWESNEDRLVAFVPATDLDDAVFSAEAGSPEFDDFETALDLDIKAFVGVGIPVDIDSTHGIRAKVTGSFAATIELQARRAGSGVYETQATFTGAEVPIETEIIPGFEAVRTETTAHTSGTPDGSLLWHELP